MINKIRKEIGDAKLIAVSKTRTNEQILALYNQNQRAFGENRVQELASKYDSLPKDIEWHLIGQLQTNKVKYIAEFVQLIHSVDSFKLLKEINKQASKYNRTIDVLFQIKIAKESTKTGMTFDDAKFILNSDEYQKLNHIRVVGIMGMATFTQDENQILNEFQQIKDYFDDLRSAFFKNDDAFKEISMGMSGDYHLAIRKGATMVRVGSLLF